MFSSDSILEDSLLNVSLVTVNGAFVVSYADTL